MSNKAITYVSYETDLSVAIVRLVRPEKLNSLSPAFWLAWRESVERANQDDEIGAMVITADGRAFSAGADMEEYFLPYLRGDIPYEKDDPYMGGLGMPFDVIDCIRKSKPIVVAVNGLAVGGGITSFLPCDVIIASELASFMFPMAKIGLVPEMGSSHYLAKRIGFTHASEILLTGRSVGPDEALRIGLINRVVSQDKLLSTAVSIAAEIAKSPAPMLRLCKELLDKNCDEQDILTVWKRESDALRQCFGMVEHRDAVTKFLVKRQNNQNKY